MVGGMAGLPLKHVKTAFTAVYKTYCSDTPGHRQRCGGLFTRRASRRGHLAAGSQEAQMRGELGALQALMARLHHCNWKAEARKFVALCPAFGVEQKARAQYEKTLILRP